MHLPLDFSMKDSTTNRQQLVCHLNNSIYGLKQASRLWFAKFSSALLPLNFGQSQNDYSLFTKGASLGLVILLVFVDDIILGRADLMSITQIKSHFQSLFKVKDLGNLKNLEE